MNTHDQNTNVNNQNLNGDNHTPEELAAAELTAYALGQLPGEDLAAFERRHSADRIAEIERAAREIENVANTFASLRISEELPPRSPELRALLAKTMESTLRPPATIEINHPSRRSWWRLSTVEWLVIGGMLTVLAALFLPTVQSAREAARRVQAINDSRRGTDGVDEAETIAAASTPAIDFGGQPSYADASGATNRFSNQLASELTPDESRFGQRAGGVAVNESGKVSASHSLATDLASSKQTGEGPIFEDVNREQLAAVAEQRRLNDSLPQIQAAASAGPRTPNPPPGGSVARGYGGEMHGGAEGGLGGYGGRVAASSPSTLRAKKTVEHAPGGGPGEGFRINFPPTAQQGQLARGRNSNALSPESAELGYVAEGATSAELAREELIKRKEEYQQQLRRLDREHSGEQYAPIYENQFLAPLNQPLSTFSIDVDTASYANTRRFLTSNRLPPRNAVRIEELVNYFRYDYPQPKDGQPFSVNMEVAECPWKNGHLVLRVGLKGKDVERAKRPASNLVFLLDVSGSMSDENKLPLLKTAMKLLVSELGENDRVSIVTYAGDAGLKLPSARGHERKKINAAIDSLSAGGSTNGSAGIELAYEQAAAHFINEGTNRVILCTDGDLNVGVTSDEALVKLIKGKAKSRVFLTVLGFGEGNLKDSKMERLADNGNGLYAYIDSVREAKKVLVEQLTGSTITIAKDVKIQIEFNPAQIASYRLLGYENRVLAAQDFNNDKKDAGEIGAGHAVTALYELVLVGTIEKEDAQEHPEVDALKYQKSEVRGQKSEVRDQKSEVSGRRELAGTTDLTNAAKSGELLTLKLRYKQPDGDVSKLLEFPLTDRGGSFHSASSDFQFAAAVASFGMVLRQSQYRGSSNLAAVEEIASGALGTDAGGYRAEFVDLVRKTQMLGAK